ncbi:MAG: hypothetical protein PHG71_06400, partial [Kiritimatiellae bacterium]|nr:hypothetical protein [Kiritimatiellia bacterium]
MITENLIEENIDGLALFAPPDPHDAGAVQVINQSRALMAFRIGDLINAKRFQASDAVPFPDAGDRA